MSPAARRFLAFLGWAIGSLGTVFLNEWMFVKAHVFNYPVTLTIIHLAATCVTSLLLGWMFPLSGATAMAWHPFPPLLWLRNILPLGLAYWGNVACNNLSFEDLEVDFLQVVKATGPMWVLFITMAVGTQKATPSLVAIIFLISGGIILASLGELAFVWRGFFLAISATILSAIRTALIENATLHSPIDPRQLYPSTGPAAFVLLFAVWLVTDGPILLSPESRGDGAHHHPDYSGGQVFLIVIGSSALAVLSNFGRYAWIASSSSIIYSVTGVLKDVVIIVFSLVFLGESVTVLKVIGICLAFSGVVWFTYLENTSDEATTAPAGYGQLAGESTESDCSLGGGVFAIGAGDELGTSDELDELDELDGL
ncbi:Cas4p protein [Thecamonas trahens ATCC 50062]|uniref:Cas4p protein n=1 Tax=Thecamonas trahens ATCC 50062 TaxID=461836 RepID=A0A0L0D9S5_THETB|nr:Cas4p protein [Thecamonas trahens ATCC 50062]KNC48841.1 Cas4p protein [Thecamonas trahens ATCC 50062]|eukprot:XP_013758261.1 Cas4p protein [Thecamonas trahens ATCC 50062]